MSLEPGSRLGSYEIVALLGAGGMGEVYRARDTRLKRDVAVKVLPDAFASDPERLARFQREAELLATLNHPNIAQIHGLEERALVLELVEGPTLSDRIARGPIPVDEALPIAKQIAEAVEAAHERGVIHRDLKPANIKVTPDGTVKVLDFGLARAADSSAAGRDLSRADLSHSPTITSPAMTLGGVILGTAAYMSPEQARGKTVDKRSDIWAFGCVLYEMLTGARAFEGDEVSDTLAAILRADPDWARVPRNVPPPAMRLLGRCLHKDARLRLRDIGEARIALDSVSSAGEQTAAPKDGSPASVSRVWLGAVSVMLIAALLATVAFYRRPTAVPQSPVQFALSLADGDRLMLPLQLDRPFAVSAQGTHVVYVASAFAGSTRSDQLMLRSLDSLTITPLRGTEGARSPFFSPDGQWIGFFAAGELRKTSLSGSGEVVTISKIAGTPEGASWSPDGTIVFATSEAQTGLLRVSGSGGNPEVLSKPGGPGAGEDHAFPHVMPGGRAVLFTQTLFNLRERFQLVAFDLVTRESTLLGITGSHPVYTKSAGLIYWTTEGLRRVAFDAEQLKVSGEPTTVVRELNYPFFDVSPSGTLVTAAGGDLGGSLGRDRTLVWVGRDGREEPIQAPPRPYASRRIKLSPDGNRLALDMDIEGGDVWVWDFTRHTLTRATQSQQQEWYPTWTPDGRELIFASGPPGNHSLARAKADGSGTIVHITSSSLDQFPQSLTTDGRLLIYRQQAGSTGQGDLFAIPSDGKSDPRPLFETPFRELNAAVSPDGRWLAFDSEQSGRLEVYVRPFPDVTSGQWQISGLGGGAPIWSRSGRELFFIAADGNMMAVTINAGTEFSASLPVRLFDASQYHFASIGPTGTYDIAPDGRRFVMVKNIPDEKPAAPVQLVITTNWASVLDGMK